MSGRGTKIVRNVKQVITIHRVLFEFKVWLLFDSAVAENWRDGGAGVRHKKSCQIPCIVPRSTRSRLLVPRR